MSSSLRHLLPVLVVLSGAIAHGEWAFQPLRSFGFTNVMGEEPRARVIEARNGWLYGTTRSGGTHHGGTLFKVQKDGTGLAVLRHFSTADEEGFFPNGLIEGTDGALYGTTWGTRGFGPGSGTIFRINTDGTGFAFVKTLGNPAAEGMNPAAGLVEGSDGLLYGTAEGGGSAGGGVAFRVSKNGGMFEVIRHFGVSTNDGSRPLAGLIEARDGALYGTTYSGGTSNGGTIFKLNRDGTGYAVLRDLGQDIGPKWPVGSLLEGSDGSLYGTAPYWGDAAEPYLVGAVFRLRTNGSEWTNLFLFQFSEYFPAAGLIEGQDGALYGTLQYGNLFSDGYGSIFRMNKEGSGYALLKRFSSTNVLDAAFPVAPLFQASDGRLYGTAQSGGASGDGAVFGLNTNGSNYIILANFSTTGMDGAGPNELTQGTDGFWYGTTSSGGVRGMGSVFRIGSDGGNYEVLWSFAQMRGDGQNPAGGVIEGNDGLLYGTTANGGEWDYGTIFRLAKNGSNYTILRSFNSVLPDSRIPLAALLEGSDGLLYGTSSRGGSNDLGTVFKLRKSGSDFTILRHFGTQDDGHTPAAPLIEASDGALYGTTYLTVFRIQKNGAGYMPLFRFSPGTTGYASSAAFLEASDGQLYGTTSMGGTNGSAGSVFRIHKDGSQFAVLKFFYPSEFDGNTPSAGLVEGPDGMLYGTCNNGGSQRAAGTVFAMNKDGSQYGTLKNFPDQDAGGFWPTAALRMGRDGALYGTASAGGHAQFGTVYRLLPVPALSIRAQPLASGTSIQCTWLQNGFQWKLISHTNVDAPVHLWSEVQAGSPTVAGDYKVIVFGDSRAFFRLMCTP